MVLNLDTDIKKQKPTLEELQEFFTNREKNMRQHGKKGKACANPEDEYKRLLNNFLSIRSRASVKAYHKRQDKIWEECNKTEVDKIKNEDGLRPVDIRRYKAKFKNCPHGAQVTLDYVRRMTGCSLYQIYRLQEMTGLYPHPKVTKKNAYFDKQRREDEGITALI